MAGYTRTFKLDMHDIQLIEDALRKNNQQISKTATRRVDAEQDVMRDIHNLLGKIHCQKEFFRPSAGVYVGG